MAMPLADPTLWSYAPKALLDSTAPLHIPARLDPKLWAFLARFGLHATAKAWEKTMAALTPIDRMALDTFDELTSNGVDAWTRKGPFVIGFEEEKESGPFIHEIQQVEKAGQRVPLKRLENPQVKVPQLSAGVSTVYEMEDQRFIEPGPFVQALADAVQARGGRIVTGSEVHSLRHGPQGIAVDSYGQEPVNADVVVLATGAWLPKLAKPLGVKTQIQAGRGYSFSVATDDPAEFPIYFPARRVACTPYQGRLRIAGTMEFRGPDEPLQTGRIDAILASVRPLFTNMDLENLEDIWVGARPVTPDGLPVVGATRSPGVYVAGGHGMWGIVLGPAT
jgi:D-amino-acid dehydrogenase